MTTDLINFLKKNNIHSYGSDELKKFEKNMERYFSREYNRWKDNNHNPEHYGYSSFVGEIAKNETRDTSIEHYDEEYRLYQAFLDTSYMAYTTGYYGAEKDSTTINDTTTLESAQIRKYELLVERCDIHDGQIVLDLGCGFGGLSKFLLERFPNIKVVGINPSVIQTNHIRNTLICDNNNFDNSRFTLIQKFFDDIDDSMISNNYFDRVISVGLLEHVSNIDLLQKNISRVLKQGGKCLHHCIVSANTIPDYINSENTYMSHYYPGAHIWPYNEPQRHNTYLEFQSSWFLNGMNYWKTLDEWHKRFWISIETLYPKCISIEKIDDWNKYFCLCKAMFRPNNGSSYGNGHYLYIKKS
jgi:cyclopropane-fatty-acyl-phospholipid synthase